MPKFRPDLRRSLWLACCIGALAATSAGAQALTLRAAIDSALRHNPDLGVARAIADSARSETRIARALPNPTYAVVPNTPMQYSVTMPLDVGPQRRYRVRTSQLGAGAVRADADDATRQLVLAVQRSYYDVLLADARRTIAADRRAIVRQVLAADSARVRAGDLPERALIRGGVELVRTDADVARAGIDALSTRLALQGLMGVASPDTALRLDGTLAYVDVPIDTSDRAERSLAHRPDVAASRTRVAQSLAAEHLAASSVLPVPQLNYVLQRSVPFESGRYYALGIGVEVPILNQYRGQRERAAAGHQAAVFAAQRIEAQASRELGSALADFRARQALVRRYESGVVAKVAQNVEATRYAYSRGATTLLEVLDAVRSQQDVMTEYWTALHDYWVAAATLRAAQGATRAD